MEQAVKLGCLVMAAGNASRFGKNKLLTPLRGKTLLERALDAVPAERFSAAAVVTQYPEVAEIAERRGFAVIRNPRPDLGLSYTVHLGTAALMDSCGAILYQVADQPELRRESVERELDFFLAHRDSIVAMAHGTRRGNPCIFPKRYFPELLSLEGDVGGSAVIRRHEDSLLLFEVEERELADIDTVENFRKLSGR